MLWARRVFARPSTQANFAPITFSFPDLRSAEFSDTTGSSVSTARRKLQCNPAGGPCQGGQTHSQSAPRKDRRPAEREAVINEELDPKLQRRLAQLRSWLHEGRNQVLPWVGAGLSIAPPPVPEKSLPNWMGLLQILLEEVSDPARAEIKCDLLDRDKLLEAADEIARELGSARVATRIEAIFRAPLCKPPPVYDLLVDLPVDQFVTTNFDPWLADALARKTRAAPHVSTPRDGYAGLRSNDPAFVFHVHGTAKRPDTCVLTAEQFANLRHGTAGYEGVLGHFIAQRNLLFLGTSLGDPELIYALERWRYQEERSGAARHVLLGFGLTARQQRKLSGFGIDAIEIGDSGEFHQLERVLRYLATPPSASSTEGPAEEGKDGNTLLPGSTPDAGNEPRTTEEDPKALAELRTRYLAALKGEHDALIPLAVSSGRNQRVEHVYVELQLAEHERARRTSESKSRVGSIGLAELLVLERGGDLGVTGRWLLRGDPGAGKSTLVRHFAWECGSGEVGCWTPVFASLAQLFRNNGKPDLEAESRGLLAPEPDKETWSRFLTAESSSGRLLLLLDGLDEVPAGRIDEVHGWLRALARGYPQAQVIVTTRKIGYRPPSADFLEVDLQPLGHRERVELLAHWLPLREDGEEDRERAEALADDLSRVQSLRELAGNPLHVTLYALLAGHSKDNDEAKPVERRSELFDRILTLLLRGGHKPTPDPETPFTDVSVRDTLRNLAHGTTVDDMLQTTKEDLQKRVKGSKDPTYAELASLGDWGPNASRFLDALAHQTSVIGPYVAGPDGPWRFLHKSFREALTAEQLARRVARDGLEPILDEARQIEGDEGRWAEPFALLAGSVKDSDALITALEEVRPSLARAALATADGVGTATAERMLGLQEGNVLERGKVILGLIDRMTYPQDGVRLLARMASESRNGNDLYFYYEALREAERRPECTVLARDARRHFFDDTLPVDTAAFHHVETIDGTKELWRRIEAGVYTVGSPDEYGNDDEHPRHEVELTGPFRIGVVPVTKALFAQLYSDRGSPEDSRNGDHPAAEVTWFEAMTFARWLARVVDGPEHFERYEDWLGSLPTDAQWEIACRAGNLGRWCFGDKEKRLGEYAWFDGNAENTTHPVARKKPNDWGLYDVHGNVREWCRDAWYREYREGRVRDPFHETSVADYRVVRGGSFWNFARNCRSAYRDWRLPSVANDYVGFRVALPAEH
ncbi:MAG: SUMF1/EgtB/PvdO family nonheme iron enzyme [bacterium]|nr:SUMF1/EgtB/PvdO family nonheme iron enzyme [bacterium]